MFACLRPRHMAVVGPTQPFLILYDWGEKPLETCPFQRQIDQTVEIHTCTILYGSPLLLFKKNTYMYLFFLSKQFCKKAKQVDTLYSKVWLSAKLLSARQRLLVVRLWWQKFPVQHQCKTIKTRLKSNLPDRQNKHNSVSLNIISQWCWNVYQKSSFLSNRIKYHNQTKVPYSTYNNNIFAWMAEHN